MALVLTSAFWSTASLAGGQTASSPPPTPKRPVVDHYHGVEVIDDYRWLENGGNPEVQHWVEAQNAYSRAYLANLPLRRAIRERVLAYLKKRSVRYRGFQYRRGTFFAMRIDPQRQQPILVSLKSPDDLTSERAIVDPNLIRADGSLAIDWFRPSPDGKLVAVAMSANGSEDASLFVYDTTSCKQVGEAIPRVNYPTAGGSVAWLPDNSTLLYTRYPQGTERPKADLNFYQQVYSHRIGTPVSQDSYVLGNELPRIAEISLVTDPASKYIVASIEKGDGGELSTSSAPQMVNGSKLRASRTKSSASRLPLKEHYFFCPAGMPREARFCG